MKPRRLSFPLATALAALLSSPSASAINLYWDTNTTGVAGSGAATGNWGLDSLWSTDSTGLNVGPVTLTATTTGLDDLFFSAGTNGTGGTVTVNGSRTARKLTFEEGAITLSGGTLITLAGGGGITVDAAAGNATVSTALTATGNNTFNVGAGRTLTLDGGAFTRSTRGALNFQLGAGSTLTSTKSGLAANDATGIIGPWASFGTAATTTYAKFSGSNIVGLGYTGGADGVSVAAAASVVTGAGNLNYTLSAAGTLGVSASVNTLRFTGATGGTLTSSTLFTTKGIMLTGASNLTLLGGAGWTAGAAANELVINVVQSTSELRMTGSTAAITGSINKTGAGIFDMRSGAAHSIGNITVNEGILITNHLNGDGIGGSATINSGGTLRWGGGSKHQNAAGFTINAGGTLDIQGFDDLIGSISGAGNITGTTGRIQVQNATATFSGVMSGTGVRFLINDDGGANDYTLSGLNTYGGTTTLERGILRINSIGNVNGGASSLGTPTSAVNGNIAIGRLNFTGTLVYTGTGHSSDRQITIGTNGTTPANTDTGGATIEANGASNAALTFSATTFSATTFNTQTNAATGVGADRVLTLQGTSTGLNTISGIIQDNLVSGTATGTAKVGVTKAQAGTWVLSGANTYTGNTTLTLGTLNLGVAENANVSGPLGKQLANAAGTIVLGGGTLQYSAANQFDYSGRFSTAASQAYNVNTNGQDVTWGTNLTSTGGTLAKSGAGILTLTGDNSFGGATTISGGTLKLTGSGRLGSGTYSGAVALTNSAIFDKSSTTTQIMSGNITGATGTVKLDNTNGELILRGSGNSYGTLNINAGRVFIQTSSAALPSGATVSLTGGTLDFDVAGTYGATINVSAGANIAARAATTLSNVDLPGTGTVIFNSDDAVTTTLSIGGNQTLTGPLTVQVGNVGGGGNPTVGAVTLGGNVDGAGGLTKTQVGTLTLSGTNSYSGTTTVSNGTLLINGNSSTATGAVAVNGGTLGGTGRTGGAVTVGATATLSPGASIESLGVASVDFLAGSTYAYELNSAALNGDLTYSTGTLDIVSGVGPLGTTLTLTEFFSGTLAVNDKLTLISYTGGWSSIELFNYLGSTLADDSTFTLGANQWLFNYNDTTGGSNFSGDQTGAVSFVTMTVIPEPRAALLGGLGLLALLRRRRD